MHKNVDFTQIKKNWFYVRRLFIISCTLACLGFLFVFTTSPLSAQSSNEFLRISGATLNYKGQTVYLQGANIHNTPWDNGWKGNVNNIIIIEADYQKLAQMGGNHFRFGLTFGMWRDTKTQFFQMLDRQISYARAHNVWILLNLFSTPNDQESSGWHCNDLASQEGPLGDFWVDIANRYKDEPAIIGYDIINEPGWCGQWDYWFNMAERIAIRINAVDPNHLIFVSATDSGTFPRKLSPSNIVYEMHHYEPGGGTHCQATTHQLTYPGVFPMWDDPATYWDKAAMAAPFTGSNWASMDYNIPSISWSRQNNVPLYVGEWGMASPPCVQGAGQYEIDTAQLYQERDLHHAYYAWRHLPTYWGIFPHEQNVFTPNFQEKYDAAVVSFTGSVRPNYGGPAPTITPQPTPTPNASPQPSPTLQPFPSGGAVVGNLTITTPLTLNTNQVASGGTVTGTVTYTNNTVNTVTFNRLVIAARPPGGTNEGGPYEDFPDAAGSTTFSPGQSRTFTATRSFTSSDPTGNWYVFTTYEDSSGWHDAPANLNQTLAVGVQVGDVNNDGQVNAQDLLQIVKDIVFKTTSFTTDIDNNGRVNVMDAAIVIQALVG